MKVNPYPKEIVDQSSDVIVSNDQHEIWQQGYEAAWDEAKAIVKKVNAEAGDIRVFERMILAAFIGAR